MQYFDVRSGLEHGPALSEASSLLEQALALVDALSDDCESEPKLQCRVYAVEFMLEAVQELLHHAIIRTQPAKEAA